MLPSPENDNTGDGIFICNQTKIVQLLNSGSIFPQFATELKIKTIAKHDGHAEEKWLSFSAIVPQFLN